MRLLVLVVAVLAMAYETQGWVVYPCRFHPLGMENGDIRNNELTSSPPFNASNRVMFARLRNPRSFAAASAQGMPWLQVSFDSVQIFTAILTQGNPRANEWVTTFYIFFKIVHGPVWHRYQNATFVGNSNRNGIKRNNFGRPYLIARWVRICIRTWFGWPSMRFELMGCPQNSRIVLVCNRNFMRLLVPRALMPPNLPPARTHLMDTTNPACRGQSIIQGQPSTNYYQWFTSLNGCNTTCFATPYFFHYYNLVSNDVDMHGLSIWRLGRLRIPFICSYRTNYTSSSWGLHPNITVWQWGKHEFGAFLVTLRLYRTVNFITSLPMSGPEYPIDLNYRIFVQIRLFAGDTHLVVKAHACWATPTANPMSMPQYFLIQNGVAVDNTVLWHPSNPKLAKIQRWSFLTFVLLKHHRFIWIHCKVYICKGFIGYCDPRPGKRGLNGSPAREDPSQYSTIASQGPFHLNIDEKDEPIKKLVHKVPKEVRIEDLPHEVTHKEAVGPDPAKYSLWEDLTS